ncbi:MAG: hypothetical protein IT209_08830 [Armatimonadetes bacterium]|nr:hypothetical protein [Armatimonadota bacterium]
MVSIRTGRNARFVVCILSLFVLGCARECPAAVDLVWRTSSHTVALGETLSLDLLAVSQTPASISAVDVIVTWDPLYLSGIKKASSQPFWLVEGFLSPQPDNLNVDITDGCVLYTGWGGLSGSINVDSSGLLLATFAFSAVRPTSQTTVNIPHAIGLQTFTVVYDGHTPNTDITGRLDSAQASVVPEPSSALALSTCLVGWSRLFKRSCRN